LIDDRGSCVLAWFVGAPVGHQRIFCKKFRW
jgi:hypothetical protein